MYMMRVSIALIGTILTLSQCLLIYFVGSGVCLNEGCEVVEGLTTVSPFIFNLAGFLFFQSVFWSVVMARKQTEFWLNTTSLLLHAALCAEAVLIFFQWQIANTFCSYCLIVFLCIVLLNLLSGGRQIITGAVLFLAVITACISLSWRNSGPEKSLEGGSIAFLAGEQGSGGGFLFFSEKCSHCEEIIDFLREANSCEIHFNPVDRITEFSLSGAQMVDSYDIQINLQFLKLLAINEIPVFVTNDMPKSLILRGKSEIEQYLQESCRATGQKDYSGFSSALPPEKHILDVGRVEENGCPVNEDCEKKSP